jgi:hypothetical protein
VDLPVLRYVADLDYSVEWLMLDPANVLPFRLEELVIYEGDEILVDGSKPGAYIDVERTCAPKRRRPSLPFAPTSSVTTAPCEHPPVPYPGQLPFSRVRFALFAIFRRRSRFPASARRAQRPAAARRAPRRRWARSATACSSRPGLTAV